MAIDSLAKVLPRWSAWAKQASSLRILKEADYPFPDVSLKFIGTIVQNYRIIRGKETAAFETWIQKIEHDVRDKLIPILQENNMLLPNQLYRNNDISESYTLTKIPNFNSLIALSQEHQTPVYSLTDEHLISAGWRGRVLDKVSREATRICNSILGTC